MKNKKLKKKKKKEKEGKVQITTVKSEKGDLIVINKIIRYNEQLYAQNFRNLGEWIHLLII